MRELMFTESEVKETAQRDLECSLDLLGVTAMEDLL
jgi:magnesium-transporting ATPase (P-type)